jgi:hypothetical protein
LQNQRQRATEFKFVFRLLPVKLPETNRRENGRPESLAHTIVPFDDGLSPSTGEPPAKPFNVGVGQSQKMQLAFLLPPTQQHHPSLYGLQR